MKKIITLLLTVCCLTLLLTVCCCVGAKTEEVPNDEIWYEASEKLSETTDPLEYGLHTNAFNASINSHTFSNGKGVIKFDSNVTSIGLSAFRGCSGLTSIEVPNSVTSIGERAFRGCSGLTSIEIPNSVTSIGGDAFTHCSELTSIKVDEGNTTYDSRNNCNAIIETVSHTLTCGCKNTIIPNSVTRIGDYAFSGSGLTSIEIPNSVTSIGEGAFFDCSDLISIEIPNSVTSIGVAAFSGSGLISIEIPNSVTSIGEGAFSGRVLTSIEIPNSVTSIGKLAFWGCSGLTSIYVNWNRPLSVPSNIFDSMFDEGIDFNTCTLYVPKGTATMYMSAPVWNNFKNIVEYDS